MSNKKSFVRGAAILAVAGLFGKVVGMFYRVWLTALITTEGMGFYQTPYALYSFLLVISSAGLPTAISKMTSERWVHADALGARTILRLTRKVLIGTGLVATAAMALFAQPIADLMGDPLAAPGFVVLAPSILFVCILSAYRGYFQGAQDMMPTAVSQLIETVGKVIFGFPLVKLLAPYGLVWGAVGAIAGVTIAELIALIYIMVCHALKGRIGERLPRNAMTHIPGMYRSLFAIAIPVTIGASMMPIVNLVDSALVINRLQDIGFALDRARELYGVLTGMVNTMINMPAVITLAFSMSLVPAVSTALAAGNGQDLRRITATGLKLALMIGSAASVGIGLLAHQILQLLYSTQSAQSLAAGGQLLAVMSIGVLFLAFVQTTTGILQGLGKPGYPVVTLAVGVVAKVVLNYVLIGIPGINILGAAYATVACYGIAALGNVFMVLKLTGTKLKFVEFFLYPVLAAGGMAASVWAFVTLMSDKMSNTMLTLGAVGVGVVVYGVLALVLGALSKEDLSMIPGGRKLGRLMDKIQKRR